MTHEFMYPTVAPAPDTAPSTDSGDPAGSADTHNDTVSGPPARAPKEPRSGPPVKRDGPLRSDQRETFHPPPTRSGGADERT
jgi:hypothetical protein